MATIAARLQPARRWIIESPISGPLITLVVVLILFSLFVPNFLTVRSMSGIVNAATLTGTITVGVTLLMIAGEFDLSVGPMMAMGAFLFGLTVEGGNPVLALLLALLVPALMGAINGFIVIRTRIPSFITTLSTLFIYRGIVWLFSGGQMFQTIQEAVIYDVFNGRLDFLADAIQGANFRTAALWWIGLVLVMQYLLVRTKFGNHVFATGGGIGAAAAQGVNVRRIKVICFILSGVAAGFAGVLLFSQFKTVRIATGAGEELKAIASAVVGGTLLTGGSGSIVGALLGVLIISMLRTGVVLTNLIPADNFEAIVGVTIVAAAIFNHWVREQS
ncbi:MAG: ABC transporter permease [Anaerolineales bacterium]|nr:MAG: ABC transporter permease [Anaerolineales bacterium]